MNPIKTPGCDAIVTWSSGLRMPARMENGFFSIYWRPTREELLLMSQGYFVRLSVMGDTCPQVKLEVDCL